MLISVDLPFPVIVRMADEIGRTSWCAERRSPWMIGLAGLSADGRYWARTSDPQLVELVLSQLS